MASALTSLVEYSNRYGSDPGMVLAGGGNTSMKTDQTLYVKGSGTSLATITEDGFVVMSRRGLGEIWKKKYPKEQAEREAAVLADMMAARRPGEENKRPSVETLLHDLFPQKFILHVHPSRVNALTCSVEGEKGVKRLFPDAVWVDECEPGYILASRCRDKLAAYKELTGNNANLVFLQNHGVFFAANSPAGLDELVARVMSTLDAEIQIKPDLAPDRTDREAATKIAPVLRMLYDENGTASVVFEASKTVLDFAESAESFSVLKEPLSPDHIVYCKAEPLFLEDCTPEGIIAAFRAFEERRGFKPKVVFAKNIGMFTLGRTLKEARTAASVWRDAMSITVMAGSFGGVRHMAPEMVDFILNWEVESYRTKVSLSAGDSKKLTGKIAVVTGSAQGFGEGIARTLAAEAPRS